MVLFSSLASGLSLRIDCFPPSLSVQTTSNWKWSKNFRPTVNNRSLGRISSWPGIARAETSGPFSVPSKKYLNSSIGDESSRTGMVLQQAPLTQGITSSSQLVVEEALLQTLTACENSSEAGKEGGTSGEGKADGGGVNEGAAGAQDRTVGRGGGGSERGGSGGGEEGVSRRTGRDDLVELPLFPLPLILFPGAILPLQIFEFRYRILMHTLIQTDLRFGIVFSGKGDGTASAVGCVGEIIRHEKLPDDRFFLVCRGEERFRVVDIVRSRPYLVGRVRWLEDKPSPTSTVDLDSLANEVETLMQDVLRLSAKMKDGPSDSPAPATAAPGDLRKSAFPTPFSFWVASTFEGAQAEQQALLELEDTAERLERERTTLRNTLNYLTAATAVKDAFSSPSSDSSS